MNGHESSKSRFCGAFSLLCADKIQTPHYTWLTLSSRLILLICNDGPIKSTFYLAFCFYFDVCIGTAHEYLNLLYLSGA